MRYGNRKEEVYRWPQRQSFPYRNWFDNLTTPAEYYFLEAVQKFTDDPLTVCEACGGPLRKVYSAVGIVFKGSGFYRTDSRNGSGPPGAKEPGAKEPEWESSRRQKSWEKS